MNNELNHFDSKGNAIMVDVTEKNVTQRQAIARGKIFVNKETYDTVAEPVAGENPLFPGFSPL